MTIQELGAIGELIGGVAVIATLIYLTIQTRQAKQHTKRRLIALVLQPLGMS